jgi:hypothetical protein
MSTFRDRQDTIQLETTWKGAPDLIKNVILDYSLLSQAQEVVFSVSAFSNRDGHGNTDNLNSTA